MSTIVRYYDAKDNPQDQTLPFAPLRDLTEDDWSSLTEWQRESVDATGFWQKTKPRPPKDETESAPKRKDADGPVKEATDG